MNLVSTLIEPGTVRMEPPEPSMPRLKPIAIAPRMIPSMTRAYFFLAGPQ